MKKERNDEDGSGRWERREKDRPFLVEKAEMLRKEMGSSPEQPSPILVNTTTSIPILANSVRYMDLCLLDLILVFYF